MTKFYLIYSNRLSKYLSIYSIRAMCPQNSDLPTMVKKANISKDKSFDDVNYSFCENEF